MALGKDDKKFVIDPVPVLTETGGGTKMVLIEGISNETTENLAGTWSGDLLQIVDVLPENFEIINFCIAELWSKARYCHLFYGMNEEKNYLMMKMEIFLKEYGLIVMEIDVNQHI